MSFLRASGKTRIGAEARPFGEIIKKADDADGVARALQVRGVRTPARRSTWHPMQVSNCWPLSPCLGGGRTGARCPTRLCTDSTVRQQRAHLWQADRLFCSVSEVDRQITMFTLAATPLACSAVMHSRHPDGQQQWMFWENCMRWRPSCHPMTTGRPVNAAAKESLT
jgi:hypothetical protein